MEPSSKAQELSFPLPRNPHTLLHAHISMLGGCAMIHLTTSMVGESAGLNAPLGSFVYAMPDRLNSRGAISTPLISSGSSIEYSTRLSKILAIKTQRPVYVGCSMNFAGMTSDEELEGLTKVVEEIDKIFNA